MSVSTKTISNPLDALLSLANSQPNVPVAPLDQPLKTVAALTWKPPRDIPPARTQWTCAVLTNDGRIRCKEIARHLAWKPGTYLNVALRGLRIELTPANPGDEDRHAPRIDSRGRLCVPPRWRRALRAEPGDDVLVSLDAGAGSVTVTSQRVVSYLFDQLERGLVG